MVSVHRVSEELVLEAEHVEHQRNVEEEVCRRLGQGQPHGRVVPKASPRSLFVPGSPHETDADKEQLLGNQYQHGRHHGRGIAAVRIVEDIHIVGYGLRDPFGLFFGHSGSGQFFDLYVAADAHRHLAHGAQEIAVEQKITPVGIEADVVLFTGQNAFSVALRNVEHAVDLPCKKELASLLQVQGHVPYIGLGRCVEHSGQFPAGGGVVQVHDGYRKVAYHLRRVDKRVQRPVDEHRPEEYEHGTSVFEDGDKLGFGYFPEAFHGISLSRSI